MGIFTGILGSIYVTQPLSQKVSSRLVRRCRMHEGDLAPKADAGAEGALSWQLILQVEPRGKAPDVRYEVQDEDTFFAWREAEPPS